MVRCGDLPRRTPGNFIFNNGPAPLHRVAAAGGEAVAMGQLADGETDRHFPAFLPDGRHFLFRSSGTAETGGVFVGSLDSDETTRILSSDTGAIFDPSSRRLLFVRQGTLLAQVFNPDTFALTGDRCRSAEAVIRPPRAAVPRRRRSLLLCGRQGWAALSDDLASRNRW